MPLSSNNTATVGINREVSAMREELGGLSIANQGMPFDRPNFNCSYITLESDI